MNQIRIPEDCTDNLFYFSMPPSVLMGSPELTAEYFVKQILDEKNLKFSHCTQSEFIDKFSNEFKPDELKNGIMLFDQQAHHLWSINSNRDELILRLVCMNRIFLKFASFSS